MRFFLYDLEELHNRIHNGGNGSIVAAIPDSKTLFIDYLYWYRSGASAFERPILKGSPKST